jgi:hypothetical protein
VKAITVRYHGPTATHGVRLSATDMDGNRITVPYPDDDGVPMGEARYRVAAVALCHKMGWTGTLAGGAIASGYPMRRKAPGFSRGDISRSNG